MSLDRTVGFLRDMLEHAEEALALMRGKSYADLENERTLGLAVTRLLEIIGEAANRISKEEQAAYAGIPWNEVISLRNRLIHGYDSVDYGIIWGIIRKDLPNLVAELKNILSRLEGDSSSRGGLVQ